jgi:hypothetical protein
MRRPIVTFFAFFVLFLLLSPTLAFAEAAEASVSLPWLLRPATTDDTLRLDSEAAAFADPNGNLDVAVTTMFTGSYRLANGWTPMLRLGVVDNDAPGAAHDDNAFANPLVGATYARRAGDFRLAFFGGATLPFGTGGARTSEATGTARPADRAMWESDSAAVLAGVDAAYVNGHFTAQGEATLGQSVRVRGDDASGGGARFATRASFGAHLGYLVGAHVAFGVDVHFEDTLTASLGVRFGFRVGAQTTIRPGLALVRGLDSRGFDAPLLVPQPTAVLIDLPVTF